MTLKIRAADPAKEAVALGAAQVRAFRSGDPAAVAAYYAKGAHIRAGETLVADARGVIAAQATAANLTMTIAGADVPTAAITLVGCAPEHRRQGAVDRLLRTLLVHARARKTPVTTLYPFSEPFYAKFGYARFDWPERFVVPPTQFRASETRAHVRRLDAERDIPALAACYDAWRAGRTGPLARTQAWWRARVIDKVQDGVVMETRRGGVEGYLLYDVQAGPMIASQLVVREHVARTPTGRRGLFGFLNALGEQFTGIHIAFPRGEGAPLLTGIGAIEAATDCLRHHVVGAVLGGNMGRVLDVRAAIASHPGPARNRARGEVGLDLADPVFRDQNASYDLRFDDRGVTIKRARRVTARLAMGVGAFSQIYFGAARARVLHDAGLAEGDEGACAILDAAFAGPTPFCSELNGF